MFSCQQIYDLRVELSIQIMFDDFEMFKIAFKQN